eukprot:SAG11_NODE_11753_length_740_cov_0.934477_2_plen_34_part_01
MYIVHVQCDFGWWGADTYPGTSKFRSLHAMKSEI